MDNLVWCKYMLKNERCQKYLEEKVRRLMTMRFIRINDDYAVEKLIKSFCEGLAYLEGLMLYNRGIHMKQIESKIHLVNMQVYMEKSKEIEEILIDEIDSQLRNFEVFLSSVYIKGKLDTSNSF